MQLQISAIRLDGGTQPREEIDWETVHDYSEAIEEGVIFPPVVVYYDGSDYWLADGFHRLHATKKNGLAEITADVRQGTLRDAVLYSVGANADHGKRRTPKDKRRAVFTMLNNDLVCINPDTGKPWSNREIARRCNVSYQLVNNMHPEIHTDNVVSMKTFTHHKTGKPAVMNTTNIGRPAAPAPTDSYLTPIDEQCEEVIAAMAVEDDLDEIMSEDEQEEESLTPQVAPTRKAVEQSVVTITIPKIAENAVGTMSLFFGADWMKAFVNHYITISEGEV